MSGIAIDGMIFQIGKQFLIEFFKKFTLSSMYMIVTFTFLENSVIINCAKYFLN